MLRPSRHIDTVELYAGAMLVKLLAIGLYVNMRKTKGTKSHVYLELSVKRASVCIYINVHAWKKSHTFRFVC